MLYKHANTGSQSVNSAECGGHELRDLYNIVLRAVLPYFTQASYTEMQWHTAVPEEALDLFPSLSKLSDNSPAPLRELYTALKVNIMIYLYVVL